jgi:hypothetical protein
MDAFKHWLVTGLSEKDPDLEFEARDLARFFTRFNLEIGRIRKDWSDSKMAKGIRHLYGSGSSYLIEVSRLPPCREVSDFFDSVPQLYKNLFEVRCSRYYSHLDRGPERANPLNGPCYMLWDMDCGIDSFRFSKVPSHIDDSIRVLGQLATSTHPATIESAIHGLGHMIDSFRDRCQPPLERLASRADVPAELRDYADNALNHYIQ